MKGCPGAMVDGAVMPVMIAFAPERRERAATVAAKEKRILMAWVV